MPENDLPDIEPTPAELAAIESEWPRIAADLAAVDAEITALAMTGRVDDLAVRRARRAARRALTAPLAWFGGEAA